MARTTARTDASDPITIHTDGACQGNPGPGGYGIVMSGGGFRREISGAEPATTNNRMEMLAAIRALEELRQPSSVVLYTDSVYLRDGITKWIHGWLAKGWKTSTGSPVKNIDLWQRLHEQDGIHRVDWRWLKGHAGHTENERCDQLAVAGARRAAAGIRDECPGESVGRDAPGDRADTRKAGITAAQGAAPEGQPGRNLEIKLRITDPEALRRRVLALGAREAGRLKQQDIFLACRPGQRLKLRHEETDGRLRSELIHYRRPDEPGVRLSEYTRVPLGEGSALQTLLLGALVETGKVSKVRELLLLGPTRVHLDQVGGLGTFIEFERVLSPADDPAAALLELHRLLAALELDPSRAESGSYRDLQG